MKRYLILSQVFYAITLFPWFYIWIISFMSFDSGVVNHFNVSLVLTVTLYPVAVIFCSIVAWRARLKKRKLAVLINLAPMFWILGFIFFILSY